MRRLGLERHLIDRAVRDRTARHLATRGVRLPTFAEIIDPAAQPQAMREALASVDPDAADAANLFRVHWFNGEDRRGRTAVPGHLWLDESVTGVAAPIAVILGDRFPMIGAHKVLAAYACLVPRLVTGQFDPVDQRAVWPSTGNYCRGGVAISKVLGCRGVAVLPEGMSEERFRWLERWVSDPADIVRTPGSESNVKEIYDVCDELARDDRNVVFNQFCEFGNHLAHYACTGPALEHVAQALARTRPALRVRAFVSATGSAGTLGAGDYLKEKFGSRTVAVEALECPTLLYNGFGEHNIQGIGDKHVPFIHNVMATDVVTGVSDRATDSLNLLCSSRAGRAYLAERRGIARETVDALASLGISGLCNVIAAIKVAKYYGFGPDDLVMTVATDSAALYASEAAKTERRHYPGGFDAVSAGEAFAQHVLGAATDHLVELGERDRSRIFNLGYYTWVEQRGVSLAEFEARRQQAFWRDLRGLLPAWDALIAEINAMSGRG